ncbi:hypothetical protein NUU61_003614 [Penicillium alfredii]|uniref:MARVEL domain-containing protein n=1 Tax=Penicillium alfredii TaxID=1506179 RepID=A0A9W9FK43_9EURO|nr:uncharacterized protein NUU61_003614 [Penicillium alfredii]KAJ5101392.1 hypothetical protein NUU61_003614 [Penicillium alfredii]
MQLFTGILRVVQLLFAVIVLGLSITLAKGQHDGVLPPATGYAAFTGALGIVASLIGFAALFIDSLDGVITWLIDGVTSLALLAGGITYAVLLRGTSCSNWQTLQDNVLLSGGCAAAFDDSFKACYYAGYHLYSELEGRCKSATADAAFMILGFLICVAVLIVSFVSGRYRR